VAVAAAIPDRGLGPAWSGVGLAALGALLALPSARWGGLDPPPAFRRPALVPALVLPPFGALLALLAEPVMVIPARHEPSLVAALALAFVGGALMLRRFRGLFPAPAVALLLLAPAIAYDLGLGKIWGEA